MYHVFGELCAHVSNRLGNALLALVQVRCLAGLGAGVGCLKVEHHLAERFGLKTVRNVARSSAPSRTTRPSLLEGASWS